MPPPPTPRGWQFRRDPRLTLPCMQLLSKVVTRLAFHLIICTIPPLTSLFLLPSIWSLHQADQLEVAGQIRCPHLVVEAEDGAKWDPELFPEIMEVPQYSPPSSMQVYAVNPNFHHHILPGPHHLHITHAHSVASVIAQFLGHSSKALPTPMARL